MAVRKSWEFFASQIAFLAFACVSFFLRHRGLSFFDVSEYATAIQGAGLPHAPGYPLYVLFGKFFYFFVRDPFEAQFWVNIFSAWVASFFLFITLSENKKTALLAVLFLFAQNLFQKYILIPEVFTLNLAMVAVLIYFHKRFAETLATKWVFGIGLMYGLGVCHHHLMALLVPASLFLLLSSLSMPSWFQTMISASAGFFLGLLPLGYLFITSSFEPDYTYFSVRTWPELLFVVLRRGYGTFKMTATGNSISSLDLLGLITGGLLKNTAYVGLVGGVAAIPFLWRSQKAGRPIAILVTSTLILFLVVFTTLANFPLSDLEGQNAFLRYLSLPSFLLLYPMAAALDWMTHRLGGWGWRVGVLLSLGLITWNFSQNNYRHYPIVQFSIAQAFRTIERAGPIRVDQEIDSRYGRCVIFALTDPFHFGGRYYNEFQAKQRCYFYSMATVITGQFQAATEQRLMAKYLGDFYLDKRNKEEILLDFFNRILKDGYRVFFISARDVPVFKQPSMQFTPVGGMLELLYPGVQVPEDKVLAEYITYLENLKVLLGELEEASLQPEALSASAIETAFGNIDIYPRITKLPPPYVALESEVRRRFERFLTQSRR